MCGYQKDSRCKIVNYMERVKRLLYDLTFLVWKHSDVTSYKLTPPFDDDSVTMVILYKALPGPVGADRGESSLGCFTLEEAVEYLKVRTKRDGL